MKTDPFRNLYDRAWKAGNDAARASTPEPMVVQQLENPFDPSSKVLYREVVSDGVCGFAWIQFKGNTAFAKWAAKQPDICVGGGYPTGKCISTQGNPRLRDGESPQRGRGERDGPVEDGLINDNGFLSGFRPRKLEYGNAALLQYLWVV